MVTAVNIKAGQTAYRIFSDGRVWSCRLNRFLKVEIDRDGYSMITLGGVKYRLARLVLTYFSRAPKAGEVARHLDGDPARNGIDNLEWGTARQNWDDRKKHRRIKSGRLKLTKEQVDIILSQQQIPASVLAKRFGVTTSRISQLRNGWFPIQSHQTSERA